MHTLGQFFPNPYREGSFLQTQFANTSQANSLCFAKTEKYLKVALGNAAITALITTPDLADQCTTDQGVVISDDPEQDFYRAHNRLAQEFQMRPIFEPSVHATARIHPTAHVDAHVSIAENVEIGPGAVVMSGSFIEADCVVGSNAVVGADGHFFKRFGEELIPVAHAGGVHLSKGAHVLAGAIVSKSLHTDFTVIGKQSVVSVKSHVSHGCKIGDRTILAGGSQVSGYATIGNDCWIGPSSTIGNLLKIGNNVSVETGSVVVESLSDGARVSGNYAVSHATNMMEYARKRRGRKK